MTEDRLDALLKQHFSTQDTDAASIARVTQRLAAPLPRQKGRLFAEWQTIILDWQFALAWPRMAALASCAVLGLAIGFAGVDSGFGRFNSPFATAAAADFGDAIFGPDLLTGARP